MARPRKTLNAEQIAQVEKLAAVLNEEQIGDFFGMTGRTFRQRMTEEPKVSSAYKRGRAHAIAGAGGKLLEKVRGGDLGAICFYLKTQAGWRETNRTEHTGANGAPIPMAIEVVLTNEASDYADADDEHGERD